MNDFLTMAEVDRTLFYGIFDAENLPLHLPSIKKNFSIIINVGHHFVFLYWSPLEVFYIDSLGRAITHEKVQAFINNHVDIEKCSVFYNTAHVQSQLSTHCGWYTILFTLYVDRCAARQTGKHFDRFTQLRFYSHSLLRNDDLCMQYIEKLL